MDAPIPLFRHLKSRVYDLGFRVIIGASSKVAYYRVLNSVISPLEKKFVRSGNGFLPPLLPLPLLRNLFPEIWKSSKMTGIEKNSCFVAILAILAMFWPFSSTYMASAHTSAINIHLEGFLRDNPGDRHSNFVADSRCNCRNSAFGNWSSILAMLWPNF